MYKYLLRTASKSEAKKWKLEALYYTHRKKYMGKLSHEGFYHDGRLLLISLPSFAVALVFGQ